MREVAEALSLRPEAVMQACRRHDVPVVELSRKTRGLTLGAYRLLLATASKGGKR
jgi:hypothetical protein